MSDALIIIDVQRGFVSDRTAHIPRAIEALQARFGTVFASRFVNRPASSYVKLIGWDRMMAGDPLTELAFAPASHTEVFEKTAYSACPDPVLAVLRERSIKTVHVCGFETDVCVLKTAADLFDLGFRPVVIEDLCDSTKGTDTHEFALTTIRRFIGRDQVRPCASLDIP